MTEDFEDLEIEDVDDESYYLRELSKLEKKLAIATKALEELELKSGKFYGCNDWSIEEQLDFIKAKCQETLYQIKEIELEKEYKRLQGQKQKVIALIKDGRFVEALQELEGK